MKRIWSRYMDLIYQLIGIWLSLDFMLVTEFFGDIHRQQNVWHGLYVETPASFWIFMVWLKYEPVCRNPYELKMS